MCSAFRERAASPRALSPFAGESELGRSPSGEGGAGQ